MSPATDVLSTLTLPFTIDLSYRAITQNIGGPTLGNTAFRLLGQLRRTGRAQPLSLALDERRVGVTSQRLRKDHIRTADQRVVKPTTGRSRSTASTRRGRPRQCSPKPASSFKSAAPADHADRSPTISPSAQEPGLPGMRSRREPRQSLTLRRQATSHGGGCTSFRRRTQLVAMASVIVTGPKILISTSRPISSTQKSPDGRRDDHTLDEDTIVITHDLGWPRAPERVLLFSRGPACCDGGRPKPIRRYHESPDADEPHMSREEAGFTACRCAPSLSRSPS